MEKSSLTDDFYYSLMTVLDTGLRFCVTLCVKHKHGVQLHSV